MNVLLNIYWKYISYSFKSKLMKIFTYEMFSNVTSQDAIVLVILTLHHIIFCSISWSYAMNTTDIDKTDKYKCVYVFLFSSNSYSILVTAMCKTDNDWEGRPNGIGEKTWILEIELILELSSNSSVFVIYDKNVITLMLNVLIYKMGTLLLPCTVTIY